METIIPEPDKAPVLLYMGQASIRIVTPENKVIYIDPYAGDAYDLPADLVLVTHDYFDHCAINRVENRSEDCVIITQEEALVNEKHQVFELDYVIVEAVEAGYNRWHDAWECVGYHDHARRDQLYFPARDNGAGAATGFYGTGGHDEQAGH